MEKYFLSWNMYDDAIKSIVKQIEDSKDEFDGIYGIPRGGLPIAVSLSHYLNLPLLLYPTKNTLVVDDIADTGKTLKSHKNKKIATIYTTSWTVTKPDYTYFVKLDKNDWIIFPWEVENGSG